MTTTSDTISVVYTIPKGAITTYAQDSVHCEVSLGASKKIVNTPTIVNATVSVDGTITFASVPIDLGTGTHKINIFNSTVADLDTNATLSLIASGIISKQTNTTSLTI